MFFFILEIFFQKNGKIVGNFGFSSFYICESENECIYRESRGYGGGGHGHDCQKKDKSFRHKSENAQTLVTHREK